MTAAVAIVGMACRYPDARSPRELWENVLAQRRAFRRMPAERLRVEDYFSADRSAPDRTYTMQAAVIEGYEFDRVRFRVAGSTFRSTDLAHWLALDVAAQALADAGFTEGEGLPRATTGVCLGNTLTGEFSRANLLRLRWPYVRRVVDAALGQAGWSPDQRQPFLATLEDQYKAPFAPVGEETLAGGLSNTIAGRICNYFDLKGGGYTVDGACAASLLAITTACASLTSGDLDVAIAGGVDLSLDPFELVGFAKTGALAPEAMRVYDSRSAGFWPGEGCGMVVLMRHADAVAEGRHIYALIRGWGVSSDGSGGITRPEVEGQLLAVQRAYRRAGFGAETVTLFEGHGTGTSVGDTTEIRTLSRARSASTATPTPPALIGSVKANIGHTKAAAGVAGLIKATLAIHTQVLPPTTGCDKPHPDLLDAATTLQVGEGGLWPSDRPLRASVSAMGFGGINTHIALEGTLIERRAALAPRERALLASAQDCELFLLAGSDVADLSQQVDHLATLAPRLSLAEMTDLAAHLAATLRVAPVRAAIVAATPRELEERLGALRADLINHKPLSLDSRRGVFLGAGQSAPRIGFLLPGQGSPAHLTGGAWRRRFAVVQQLYEQAGLPTMGSGTPTAIAQPAIATASLAGLRVLNRLDIHAQLAVGHSLGEIIALHWAGALDEAALLRVVRARGQAMTELGAATGAMASIAASQQEVEALLNGDPVQIAGLNSPRQTVISGVASAVDAVTTYARNQGMTATRLPVSHAFHSPLVAAAAPALAHHLTAETFQPLQGTVISTVTGALLASDEDLAALLYRQITAPVRFMEAVTAATDQVDLWLEVGPGNVLSGLLADFVDTPTVPLDSGGASLGGLLRAVGAAYALGTPLKPAALFEGRFTRPFDLNWRPRFFVNPCELAPLPEVSAALNIDPHVGQIEQLDQKQDNSGELFYRSNGDIQTDASSPLELVRQLVAERAELPAAAVQDNDRLLSDLHLNSITVGQLVAQAARTLNMTPPVTLTDLADSTVVGVAQALEEMAQHGQATTLDKAERPPLGIDTWVHPFTVDLVERPLPRHRATAGSGYWRILAPANHPLAATLEQALPPVEGGGVVVCLPLQPDERHVGLLLAGAQAVLAQRTPTHFVLVQHGGGAAAFARTLHLEAPQVTTCVVDLPPDHPQAVEWVVAETQAAVGYSEAHYDEQGRRREPVLRALPLSGDTMALPLGAADVVLVSGGGKGVTAEIALALAAETGARLALLGRSQPDEDAELAANLARLTAAGIQYRYLVADITDAEAVQAAVHAVESTLGAVTAIIHGAARNVPQRLASLDEATFLSTLAPKLQGGRNLLAAVKPGQLRLFIALGSIIARTGLWGQADYGLANEWLVRLAERYQTEHPLCRVLALEYSIWSDIGMGTRLGRVEALAQAGIAPIPPRAGVAVMQRLLAQPSTPIAVVVMSRVRDLPTLHLEQPDLPFLRFLERPKVYYPGVELVVEADLSPDTDAYLNDHVLDGVRLLPGVIGLEAMAQAALALTGAQAQPSFEFEEVTFLRPVVVGETSLTIRVVALAREPYCVEVALRCAETAFQVDHFRAICRVGQKHDRVARTTSEVQPAARRPPPLAPTRVPIQPKRDLYGNILFHTGRFQRLHSYRHLTATRCVAEILPDGTSEWFGRYLPPTLLLGDPAVRDAAIHAIQACIPHARLLPISAERVVIGEIPTTETCLVEALERGREGDTFIYDLQVIGPKGELVEQWTGLRLRVVDGQAFRGPWIQPLLGPYLERRLQELLPGATVGVALEHHLGAERRTRSDHAIQHALGETVTVWRHPNGKPEVAGSRAVSAAHVDALTLAVAGQEPLGCDLEVVTPRPDAVWRDLLGPDRFMLAEVITRSAPEDVTVAATRVWAAGECLKKAGAGMRAPLGLAAALGDGWVLLSSGSLRIATWLTSMQGMEHRLVVAVLAKSGVADL